MEETKERPEQQGQKKEEYTPPRFVELVLSVGAGALQAMGLGIPDKEGKEPEPNLELARYSIDLLDLLREKTRGNLNEEEGKFLEEMLHQLRLKYLETADKRTEEA